MGRKLGQHFLKDRRALGKIAGTLEIKSGDTIVEVGLGHGELTEFLIAAQPRSIVAVEKDKGLADTLRQKLQITKNKSQKTNIKIIEGDILKVLPKLIPNYKLVGNIPYYLTGYLFRKISELTHSTDAQGKSRMPKLIVFTIQKEVAERICAEPPKMNLLAASVQFWGKPEIVGRIPKKSFRPPPRVDSAVIKITPVPLFPLSRKKGDRAKKDIEIGIEKYYRFIKILFKQPRKTVMNNLREGLKISQEEVEAGLKTLRIPATARPANLKMTDINKLAVIFGGKEV